MHARPHRQNSDFQLRHFLVGDCKTPDGAYILMYNQQIDMQTKLEHAKAQKKRQEAKVAKCNYIIEHASEFKAYEVLDAEADKLEIEADIPVWEMNLTAAKMELETIQKLMLELKPKCKYAHLPILEMSEACQEEEWLLELVCRAENYLLTQGTIPADQFQTMRLHPQFKEKIVPHIKKISNEIDVMRMKALPGEQGTGLASLMLELNTTPLLIEA